MNTIKPIFAQFLAFSLALFSMFVVPVPAHASGLTNGGYHDDGVGPDGNHYYEIYWYSGDPHVDCSPTSGTDGSITVQFSSADYNNGSAWVPASDTFQSWSGQSGFSQRECQVNVAAPNGAGQREIFVSWTLNGTTQAGNPEITLTF